jgi:hypothetical protein
MLGIGSPALRQTIRNKALGSTRTGRHARMRANKSARVGRIIIEISMSAMRMIIPNTALRVTSTSMSTTIRTTTITLSERVTMTLGKTRRAKMTKASLLATGKKAVGGGPILFDKKLAMGA